MLENSVVRIFRINDSAACTLLNWLLLKTMSNVMAASAHKGPALRQFCRVDEIMLVVVVVVLLLEEERLRGGRRLLVMAIWRLRLWLSVAVEWQFGGSFSFVQDLLLRDTPIVGDGRPAA